jgi:hypothetical protein
MPHSYYIYYRIAPEQASACEARVRALFAEIQEATGVQGSLMVKRGEPLLWMEVYERVADEQSFERALASALERSGLEACLQSGASRRIECFASAPGWARDAS